MKKVLEKTSTSKKSDLQNENSTPGYRKTQTTGKLESLHYKNPQYITTKPLKINKQS